MNDRASSSPVPAALVQRLRRPATQLWCYAATMFLSATLLFSVQPMFAKMALPKLGGSPSVWAVSLCFFQAVLLAGYCYAHALGRLMSPSKAVIIHLAVLTATALALPIALPSGLAEQAAGNAYIWLAGILALGVGLPFFAVSATAPLLQAWFARTGHQQASDPYFLYGASNLGSLLALLAYPVAIEPAIGLNAQAVIWSLGFGALAIMIAASATIMMEAPVNSSLDNRHAIAASDVASPVASERLIWIALALVPSGLMVAITTHLTTDIASAPFLWVIPLALFLLTFILVFRDHVPSYHAMLPELLPALVLSVILVPVLLGQFGIAMKLEWKLLELVLVVTAFFVAALVCHRELYNRRPSARHLTEFYIWMSVGGVLGGLFSAIVAPLVFSSTHEFMLLLLASLFCRPGILLARSVPMRWSRVLLATTAAAALLLVYKAAVATELIAGSGIGLYMVAAILLAGLAMARNWPEHRFLLVTCMVATAFLQPGVTGTVHATRSFFGTIRVIDTPDGEFRQMLHGTTLHGARRLKDAATGRPVTAALPATYYHPHAPMTEGLDVARALVGGDGAVRVGIVGLGTGALTCYARKADNWRYFEIDPVVAEIARDARYFDYISRCAPNIPIVIGDARLTLARQPDTSFDYLVIDAFSSDTVPVHLLTREALTLYLDKVGPRGLIAMHVSNRYMELPRAVAATLAEIPGAQMTRVFKGAGANAIDAASSDVLFVSRNPEAVAAVRAMTGAESVEAQGVTAWTDDYSDVVSAMLRKLTSK